MIPICFNVLMGKNVFQNQNFVMSHQIGKPLMFFFEEKVSFFIIQSKILIAICSLDGSDEPPNCPKETCQTKHFTCEESKKCIPLE